MSIPAERVDRIHERSSNLKAANKRLYFAITIVILLLSGVSITSTALIFSNPNFIGMDSINIPGNSVFDIIILGSAIFSLFCYIAWMQTLLRRVALILQRLTKISG